MYTILGNKLFLFYNAFIISGSCLIKTNLNAPVGTGFTQTFIIILLFYYYKCIIDRQMPARNHKALTYTF